MEESPLYTASFTTLVHCHTENGSTRFLQKVDANSSGQKLCGISKKTTI
jgi:hypothetical protein